MADPDCAHRCCGGVSEGHMHLFGPDECTACQLMPPPGTPSFDVPLLIVAHGEGEDYADAAAHAIQQVKLAGFDVMDQVPILNPQHGDKAVDN